MKRTRSLTWLLLPLAVIAATVVWASGTRGLNDASVEQAFVPKQATPRGEAGEATELRARAKWFYEQRMYPFDSIPAGAMTAAHHQAQRLPAVSRLPEEHAPVTWTLAGPEPIGQLGPAAYRYYNGGAPYAGRVNVIAPDPSDANVAYLGSANGGVWKTTDAGVTWVPTFDDKPSIAIGSVAVDPSSPSTLYAGTGDSDGFQYFGDGIYKSTDAATSWTKVGGSSFDGCFIADMVVDPADSNVIVAAVMSFYSPPSGPGTCPGAKKGIWRSGDAGATWSHAYRGGYGQDIAVDPMNPSVWYAGVWYEGVLKSTDDGVTWTVLGGGLPTNVVERVQVAAASDGETVYTLMTNPRGNVLGVYSSRDNGATWTLGGEPDFCNGTCYGYTDIAQGQGWYDLALAVDPTNRKRVYIGGVWPSRSTNGGETWMPMGNNDTTNNPKQVHVDIHALTVDPFGRLWLGSDGGAYRSADNGVSFTNLNASLSITQFISGVAGALPGQVLGGTQDNGTLLYSGSPSWTEVTEGDGGYSAIDPTNPDVMFGTYVYLWTEKSTDGFDSYENKAYDDCMGEGWWNCLFYAPLVMDQARPQRVYVGTREVWRTVDQWDTDPKIISPTFRGMVSAIAPAPSSPQTVYAGTSKGELRVTQNAGADGWPDTATNGLPRRFVTDIVVDPAAKTRAWVAVSGFGSGHIFKTTNAGRSWTDVSGDLPDAPVNALAIDVRTSPPTVYAGTDAGVYSSTDGGTTWMTYGAGLPNVVVLDVILDTTTDTLTAATYGRSMWSSPIS